MTMLSRLFHLFERAPAVFVQGAVDVGVDQERVVTLTLPVPHDFVAEAISFSGSTTARVESIRFGDRLWWSGSVDAYRFDGPAWAAVVRGQQVKTGDSIAVGAKLLHGGAGRLECLVVGAWPVRRWR